MNEKKKPGIGAILTIITAIVTAAGLILYMQNCGTNYFSNMGVNSAVTMCLAAAAVLEILMVILSMALGSRPYLDILPVISGVLTATALINFVGSRIAGAASIMTFEANAENMADLKNAIVAMAVCAAALICIMITSFFKVVKE